MQRDCGADLQQCLHQVHFAVLPELHVHQKDVRGNIRSCQGVTRRRRGGHIVACAFEHIAEVCAEIRVCSR